MAGGGTGKLLPVGFLFGAKDDGASNTLGRITERFNRLGEDSEEAANRGSNAWTRFNAAINALSFARLGGIADSLQNIAEQAGAGMQATSIEQFGAQFSQTYRQATAGMGQFRGLVDEVRGQISSAAFTYQVSAEGMLAATTALARSGTRLEDYGLSVRALAGAEQAGALSGENLGNVLTQLNEMYGMGAEGAGRMLDVVTAIGERTGAGVAATAALPDVMNAVTEAAGRFPSIGENADVAIESIMRLASATQQIQGGTFQTGVQSAIQVFNELAATRGQMQALITGLGTEFPDLAREIGISSGDIDASMTAVMQDPLRFAQSMQTLFAEGRNGQMMSERLTQALGAMGPQFLQLVHGGEQASTALAAASGEIDNTSNAFNRMARSAAGSTRTFGENMELLRERFRTHIATMTSSMPGYQNFEQKVLRRQSQAYQNISGVIDRLANRSGPFGALTRIMIATNRGGVGGLMYGINTELAGAFPRLASAINDTLPVLGALTNGFLDGAVAMGPYARLLSDFGLIGGLKNFTGAANLAGGATRGFTAKLASFALTLGVAALAIGAVVGVAYLLYRYWDRIPGIIERAGAAFENLANIGRDLSRRFVTWVSSIDWHRATRDIATRFIAALGDAFNAITRGGGGGGRGGRIMAALSEMFMNIGSGLRQMISGIFSGLFEAVGLDGLSDMFGGIFDTIVSIGSAIGRLTLGAFGSVVNVLSNSWATISEYVNQVGSALGDIFNDAAPMIADFGFALEEVGSAFGQVWDEIAPVIQSIVGTIARDFLGWILPETETGVVNVGDRVRGTWFRTIKPVLMTLFTEWISGFGRIARFTLDVFQSIAETGVMLTARISAGIEIIRIGWRNMINLMRTGWGAVRDNAIYTWTRISVAVSSFLADILDTWDIASISLKNALFGMMNGVIGTLARIIGFLPESIRSTIPGVEDIYQTVTNLNRDMVEQQQRNARELANITDRNIQRHRDEAEEVQRVTNAAEASNAAFAAAREQSRAGARGMGDVIRRYDIEGLQETRQLEEQFNRARDAIAPLVDVGNRMAEGMETGATGVARRTRQAQPLAEAIANARGLSPRQRQEMQRAIQAQVQAEGMGISSATATSLARQLSETRGPISRRDFESIMGRIRGEEEVAAARAPTRERRVALGTAGVAAATPPAPAAPTGPTPVVVTNPEAIRTEVRVAPPQGATPAVPQFASVPVF